MFFCNETYASLFSVSDIVMVLFDVKNGFGGSEKRMLSKKEEL